MNLDGKSLVTGATGFIGGRLAERLLTQERASVRVLVRTLDKANHLASLGAEVVQGDLLDRESLQRAMRDCDLVFHCAALLHSAEANRESFHEVNVEGTQNTLEAAREADVARFIYLSSIGVYGVSPKPGTQETDPYQMSGDPYCDSKIEAEQIVLRFAKEMKLPVVIIRPANVYGPRSAFWTLALLKMIEAGQIKLIDDGKGMSNHVYIDNLVDAIILAARGDSDPGDAFIISDGVNTDWKEFLGYYVRMLGQNELASTSKSTAWLSGFLLEGISKITGRPPALSRRAVGYWTQKGTYTITKAKTKLGYNPRVSLEEGMLRTERWLREAGHLTH